MEQNKGDLEMRGNEDEGQIAISGRQYEEGLTEKERVEQTLEVSVRGFTQQTYKEENSKKYAF